MRGKGEGTFGCCGCDDHSPGSLDATMHALRIEAERLGPGAVAIADQADAHLRELREQAFGEMFDAW